MATIYFLIKVLGERFLGDICDWYAITGEKYRTKDIYII